VLELARWTAMSVACTRSVELRLAWATSDFGAPRPGSDHGETQRGFEAFTVSSSSCCCASAARSSK